MWRFLLCAAATMLGPQMTADAARPDKLALWKQGALRGANLYQLQHLEDLRVLRSWGANLVEIPLFRICAPEPPYALQPDALAKVDRLVEAAEKAGLFAVLTCREGPGRADFDNSYELWKDAEAQAAYIRMWQHIAKHYLGRPSIVGYDLVCEPHPDQEARHSLGDWNAFAKKITQAIRAIDKDTPLLVTSSGWGYPQLFAELKPTGDPRTVYVVHFYSPWKYNSQPRGGTITYPGAVPGHAMEPTQHWDQQTIEETLASVRAFAKAHHVPIFVGEFGCRRWAPNAVRYLRDQLELYEQGHWSWAYWSFREGPGWDDMEIEMTSDPKDLTRYPDTPALRLFKEYFAKNTVWFEEGGSRP